jgi:hypothetical protein
MRDWQVDWFSSAAMFPGWAEYRDDEWALWRGPPSYEPLLVVRAGTWLLQDGWKKAGAISCHDVPSARR